MKSSELAANGLSPPGVGAGLGAPKIPPVGTPKGDAGAIPDDPNMFSDGAGAADPNMDEVLAGAVVEPNKLFADGAGADPKIDDVLLAGGAAPNGLAGGSVTPEGPAGAAEPKIDDPDGAAADPKMDAPAGAAELNPPVVPKIDDVPFVSVLVPNIDG